MTRITKMGRKTHLDATPYEKLAEARRAPLPPQNELETKLGLKKHRSEHRRQEREIDRNQGKVCFQCREEGHRAQDCPQANGDSKKQICYRCGRSDHSLKGCRVHPSKGLPFAECFVCKQKGHITTNCPTNGNGIYPLGGSCMICRSIEHLAKDCPVSSEIHLGTVVGNAGVNASADDDDFHDVARMELRRSKVSLKRAKSSMQHKSKMQKIVNF